MIHFAAIKETTLAVANQLYFNIITFKKGQAEK